MSMFPLARLLVGYLFLTHSHLDPPNIRPKRDPFAPGPSKTHETKGHTPRSLGQNPFFHGILEGAGT